MDDDRSCPRFDGGGVCQGIESRRRIPYLAQKFPFAGDSLTKSIAATFNRRGTAFPAGLPPGLTPMFGNDPAKIRGWQAFWRKTGPKNEMPTLAAVIELLVKFLEPPLDAAAKDKTLTSTWKNPNWINR